jgi:hypothetical protein
MEQIFPLVKGICCLPLRVRTGGLHLFNLYGLILSDEQIEFIMHSAYNEKTQIEID